MKSRLKSTLTRMSADMCKEGIVLGLARMIHCLPRSQIVKFNATALATAGSVWLVPNTEAATGHHFRR